MGAKNIEFDLNLEKIRYHGDKALLYQIWANLIGNAIRYTGDHGMVSMRLSQTGGMITASVRDNGIGMNQAQQEMVFERFYRADEARTSDGTGFGLSIAKRIVLLYGGSIAVTGQENQGTEFTVRL